ncbi:MAG: hypothetical protein DI587_38235 [Variovorax paradoxus]|nr:MAG: hypothetical protein DI583_38235 [Variovorax paradoxus]PZP99618.1 MAG: hypothetical protein DI587_38235 [Variovorax paradoxus]
MEPLPEFREIVSTAVREFGPASGAPEIIPFGAALVSLARRNPELREQMEAEFIACLGHAPLELLEFCMHALRWENLKAYFQSQQSAAIAKDDWRAEPFYRSLVEAFDDDWEDARDFYTAYFRAAV